LWGRCKMDRKTYISHLESQNGACSCPDLARLFALRKSAEKLEERCEDFHLEFDDSVIRESDLPYLSTYREAIDKFVDATENYSEVLQESFEAGKVVLSSRERGVETIHCAQCSQQIGVLSEKE